MYQLSGEAVGKPVLDFSLFWPDKVLHAHDSSPPWAHVFLKIVPRINCRGTIVQSVVKICYQASIIKIVCHWHKKRGKNQRTDQSF